MLQTDPNGDMASYRSRKAPLHFFLYVPQLGRVIPPRLGLETEIEAAQQETREMLEKMTDSIVEEWVRQTNNLFVYLSDGRFSLELAGIKRVSLDLPSEFKPIEEQICALERDKLRLNEGFKMVVTPEYPSNHGMGIYCGEGIFMVHSRWLHLGEAQFPHDGPKDVYRTTGMHEIGHGLIGGHCEPKFNERNCLMNPERYDRARAIILCGDHARIAGWVKKPCLDPDYDIFQKLVNDSS
ncbi:MAG TPA: hypothetical protein VJG90_02715 [Candidatus Nanoarchaeia archaeon]|nr:hypothetical protein [Candidatus Nanoarchaeia archaeon]